MKKPTCKDCPYWEDSKFLNGRARGDCRRYAPGHAIAVAVAVDSDGQQSGEYHDSATACSLPDGWCGEHPDFQAWMNFSSEKTYYVLRCAPLQLPATYLRELRKNGDIIDTIYGPEAYRYASEFEAESVLEKLLKSRSAIIDTWKVIRVRKSM